METYFIDDYGFETEEHNGAIEINVIFKPYVDEIINDLNIIADKVRYDIYHPMHFNGEIINEDICGVARVMSRNNKIYAFLELPAFFDEWLTFYTFAHEAGHIVNKHPEDPLCSDEERCRKENEADEYAIAKFQKWVKDIADPDMIWEMNAIIKAAKMRIRERINELK